MFCTRFVLYKLFCSSKQKKVMAKTKIWKSRLLSPVARTQGAVWQNEGDLGGFWVETNLLMKFRQNRSRRLDWTPSFLHSRTLKHLLQTRLNPKFTIGADIIPIYIWHLFNKMCQIFYLKSVIFQYWVGNVPYHVMSHFPILWCNLKI